MGAAQRQTDEEGVRAWRLSGAKVESPASRQAVTPKSHLYCFNFFLHLNIYFGIAAAAAGPAAAASVAVATQW